MTTTSTTPEAAVRDMHNLALGATTPAPATGHAVLYPVVVTDEEFLRARGVYNDTRFQTQDGDAGLRAALESLAANLLRPGPLHKTRECAIRSVSPFEARVAGLAEVELAPGIGVEFINRQLAASGDAVQQWLPIESAPKDGSRLLLHYESRRLTKVGKWDSGCRYWDADQWMHETPPTHWMPLPTPPAAQVGVK